MVGRHPAGPAQMMRPDEGVAELLETCVAVREHAEHRPDASIRRALWVPSKPPDQLEASSRRLTLHCRILNADSSFTVHGVFRPAEPARTLATVSEEIGAA